MSFLRRIEFLEPGKNPILSDMGLSFGKEMMRIDAHILDTPELHLYVNRVLPAAIAHSPYQRLRGNGPPSTQRPQNGEWRQCGTLFFKPSKIDYWMVVVFASEWVSSSRPRRDV
jgi:hypothetical protein